MADKKTKKETGKRRDYLAIGLILYIAALFLAGIFGERGLIKNYKLYKHNASIKNDILSLKTENRGLSREIDNLKGNLRHIEKIAREEFNMGRQNEITFVFKDRYTQEAPPKTDKE